MWLLHGSSEEDLQGLEGNKRRILVIIKLSYIYMCTYYIYTKVPQGMVQLLLAYLNMYILLIKNPLLPTV